MKRGIGCYAALSVVVDLPFVVLPLPGFLFVFSLLGS
jgi:hypothetical protein